MEKSARRCCRACTRASSALIGLPDTNESNSGLMAAQVMSAVHEAGLSPIHDIVAAQLATYGNLLMRWSKKTNLTAISTPEGILHRHLVESVAAAQAIPAGVKTLLDYGSGAGLPGIPIALCRSEISVTLAESQSKKVAFLREATRQLDLQCSIFSKRVDEMPRNARFGAVTMRAVDKMEDALDDAALRVEAGGLLVLFTTANSEEALVSRWPKKQFHRIPLPTIGHLLLFHPGDVPRGT